MAGGGGSWSKNKSGSRVFLSGSVLDRLGVSRKEAKQQTFSAKEIAQAKKALQKDEQNRKATPKTEEKQPATKLGNPGTVGDYSVSDIKVDPRRFQFKLAGEYSESGRVGSLDGVRKWDANLAGVIQVWKDPKDGQTYVVNGHNRLDLAKKLGAEKVTVRFLEANNAQEARAIGALTNIAEGRGTTVDAAKFFKDTGITKEDLVKKGIPMKESTAKDGLALSKLEPGIFRQVIDGNLSPERGAIIGEADLSPAKQQTLVNLIQKKEKSNIKLSNDGLKELVEISKASESRQSSIFDLFGAREEEQSFIVECAQLQANFRNRLAREQKLFSTVSRGSSSQTLQKAGNNIDVTRSKTQAEQTKQILSRFDATKNLKGEVSTLLNEGARRIADGESKSKVEKDIYAKIAEQLAS